MGQKRQNPQGDAAPKGAGRPRTAEGGRAIVLTIRARPDWKEWLVAFAEHCRSDMADVVDDALEAHAKAKGFRPPPRR